MERTRLRRLILIGVLLTAVTLASFWPVFSNDFINFDDPEYVLENPQVRTGLSWDNVNWAFRAHHASNWHPLTWLSHMLDVELFGLRPVGHHAINLLFHILNTVLLFLLLHWITGGLWRSALVAALFGLHPLHVESVAWVAERKDVLSTFFFMVTLAAYAAYAKQSVSPATTDPTENPPAAAIKPTLPKFTFYLLALVFFACGLMSKPMLVTLPCVLLLLDFWPLQRLRLFSDQKIQFKTAVPLLVEKAPFFVLSAIACAVTMSAQTGAVAPAGLPLASRAANAVLSYFRYLEKVVWPTKLAIFYPHPATVRPDLSEWITWEVGLALLVLVVVTVASVRSLRSRPYLAVGWFWYLGMLVPVIGLVQVGAQAMADRYTYVPVIGLFVALIWSAAEWVPRTQRPVPAMATAAVVLLGTLGWLTWKQAQRWKSSLTVFAHALAVTRDNATAHFNYGAALEASGDWQNALNHYRKSLQADPFRADAHYNIGHALTREGNIDGAAAEYRAALNLKPDYADAHHNLATVLHGAGQLEQAAIHYRRALELNPIQPRGYRNFGKLLVDQGKYAEAIEVYSQALKLQPQSAESEAGLGLAMLLGGRTPEAIPHLQAAATLRPDNVEALLNLANALFETGREAEARHHIVQALRLEPGLVQKTLQAGEALARQGDTTSALARFIQAVRLAPDNPDAQRSLGLALAQQGLVKEAAANFAAVVRLRPDADAHYNLALACVALGRHSEAITEYRAALKLQPERADALNDLAWILATHPQAELRDGIEAIALAEKACAVAEGKMPSYYGTLDAAYAEAGRFEEAIATAKKTRQIATAAGLKEIADAAEERLKLYEQKQPFRQKVTGPSNG
jgi:tetratricopeptide (TPR) repeat protein